YFSKPDWHSQYYWWNRFPPLDRNVNYPIKHYPDRWKKFVDYTYSQIDELVSNYGKLDILWLDGGWVRKKTEDEEKQAMADAFRVYGFGVNAISQDINMPRLAKLARAKQPQLIIVDRDVPGEQQNYLTPEQHIPDLGLPYPWETCMTMGNSWSYVPNDVYKPTAEIIKKLVDIVSKGGNYLLNIGPSPEGEFDTVAYQRLEEIGKWMKMNSEAIYSTGMYKVFGEGENIRFTQSKDGKTIYVFLLEIPDEKLLLQKLNPSKNAKITMLGSKQRLKWKSDANGTEIRLPITVVNIGKYARVLKVSE
ncbi:MAG TPA: alpha-L-fucosidase, partial [Saprospiraceae bacterium]|nr:alpha-L-fucosidase [Saprospiraceae bacterium]